MSFSPYRCSILVRITIHATRRVDFLTDLYFFFLLLSSPCDFRFASDIGYREYRPEDPEHYFPAVVGVSYTLLLYQEILVYKILLQSKRYFLNLEDLRTNALPSLSRDCFGVTTAGKPVVKILA